MRIWIAAAVMIVILAAGLAYLMFTQTGKQASSPTAPTMTPAVEWKPDGKVSEGEYQGEVELAGGRFRVYWRSDGEYLYMALVGETEGWVAIGFEPTVRMKDADMVIGWVKGGKAYVVDAFSTGETGPHPPDTKIGGSNDILAYGGSEGNGVTVIEFKRKLDTGDKYDKPLVPGRTVKFLFAMADSDQFTKKHNVAKGSGQFVLRG